MAPRRSWQHTHTPYVENQVLHINQRATAQDQTPRPWYSYAGSASLRVQEGVAFGEMSAGRLKMLVWNAASAFLRLHQRDSSVPGRPGFSSPGPRPSAPHARHGSTALRSPSPRQPASSGSQRLYMKSTDSLIKKIPSMPNVCLKIFSRRLFQKL